MVGITYMDLLNTVNHILTVTDENLMKQKWTTE